MYVFWGRRICQQILCAEDKQKVSGKTCIIMAYAAQKVSGKTFKESGWRKLIYNIYVHIIYTHTHTHTHTQVSGKTFIKKSGWRKLAMAFDISFEIRQCEITHNDQGNVRFASFIVRGMLPNGRFADAWGVCVCVWSLWVRVNIHQEWPMFRIHVTQPLRLSRNGQNGWLWIACHQGAATRSKSVIRNPIMTFLLQQRRARRIELVQIS